MTYRSTKTYTNDIGLSAVFRQWRADSHCNMLHGYALGFRFEFEATHLDGRNWVIDFGRLKRLKAELEAMFDHKCVIAEDDPELEFFRMADARGLLHLKVVPAVGCEAFARMAFVMAEQLLVKTGQAPRVRVASVECKEHGANSAIYSQAA